MRKTTMTNIWLCQYLSSVDDYGNTISSYTEPIKIEANIQQDFTELEHAEFGSDVSGMLKIRVKKPLRIKEGDGVYLSKPVINDVITINGIDFDNYGYGDYTVISTKHSYVNNKRIINPNVIIAKKER